MFTSIEAGVDAYQKLYYERMALEKEAALTKAAEKSVMQWLLEHMQAGKMEAANGTQWVVFISSGVNAQFENEKLFYEFIAKRRALGSFDLLYRRINQDKARTWAERYTLPGLTWEPYFKLHHRSRGHSEFDLSGVG